MIVIPHCRLPEDEFDRHTALRAYFCDIDAIAKRTDGGWELTLSWSDDCSRCVDPSLKVGLEWWGEHASYSNMIAAMRRSGRTLITLYDTWTLYSWSKWLCLARPSPEESIVILHVDDHRDHDSPRLFIEDGALRDPLSGLPVAVDHPDSVRSAILSGAVGMGSFIAPFLHAVPAAEIRHLCQSTGTIGTTDYEILLIEANDTLIDRHARRPGIRLRARDRGTLGPSCQRITPHLCDWLQDIGPRRILLHIDMDYFNNRYNGDSDWRRNRLSFDPSLSTIMYMIDELTTSLHDTGCAHRIEDIVVALSPGFFPAEHWRPAISRLVSRLGEVCV